MKSLVLTDFYERPFKPEIGCGLRQLLFENFHPAIVEEMKTAIGEVIGNYEPRASIISVDMDARPDSHAISASIVFSIINDAEPIVLDVILERIR